MTASPREALFQQAPTSADVDRLTSQFLGLEKKADEAYRFAAAPDETHERMRRDLVCLVEEFVQAQWSRTSGPCRFS